MRTASTTLLASVALGTIVGCARGPAVDYLLPLNRQSMDRFLVQIDVDGTAGGVLMLKGYAPREAMRLEEIGATDRAGRPLAVHLDAETLKSGKRLTDRPRLTIENAGNGSVHVRYSVRLGNREGDDHVGYTGRCHTYSGEDFGFAIGRSILLVPEPSERLRGATVRFVLPDGWQAVTPWPLERDRFRVGGRGLPAAEHLVSAAL